MAFGQAVSTSLFEEIIRASEDRADAATNLTPPRLVRQRAVGTDPPPGLPHPTPPPPSRGLAALPSTANPFQIPVSASFPTQRAVPFGGDVDEGAPPGWGGEARPSPGPHAVPFDGDDDCPPMRRAAAGEPPVPEMNLNDCAHAISRIANNNTPPLPACVRTIAIRGIARTLEGHARCSHDAERARSLRECASALRSLTWDTAVDYTLRRAILLEIEEIIYER